MTPLLTPEEIQAIKEREQAATPGPWNREHGIIWGDSGRVKVAYSGALTHDVGTLGFIAAARTDVPALLADREAMRALLRQAEKAILAGHEVWQDGSHAPDGVCKGCEVKEAALAAIRAALEADRG